MKKFIVLICIVFLTTGCSFNFWSNREPVEIKEKVQNSRIKYRDLTKEVFLFKAPPRPQETIPVEPEEGVIENPTHEPQQETIISLASYQSAEPVQVKEKPQTVFNGIGPSYFVEFANDSYKDFDLDKINQIVIEISPDSMLMIVGHSHGNSAVGTRQLASKRSETMMNHLATKGYENLHVMAFWGKDKVPFAPNRGVHIYVFDTGSIDNSLPIVVAKTINNKSFKDDSQHMAYMAD